HDGALFGQVTAQPEIRAGQLDAFLVGISPLVREDRAQLVAVQKDRVAPGLKQPTHHAAPDRRLAGRRIAGDPDDTSLALHVCRQADGSAGLGAASTTSMPESSSAARRAELPRKSAKYLSASGAARVSCPRQ